MKFHLSMKTPDIVDDTLYQLIEADHSQDEISKAKKMMKKVLEYEEYLKVEIDTDKETFTVLKKDGTHFN